MLLWLSVKSEAGVKQVMTKAGGKILAVTIKNKFIKSYNKVTRLLIELYIDI